MERQRRYLQRRNVLGWHSKVKFPEEVDFFTSMINDVQKEIYLAEEYKYELKVDSCGRWSIKNIRIINTYSSWLSLGWSILCAVSSKMW